MELKNKYLKYKNKYLLSKMLGGSAIEIDDDDEYELNLIEAFKSFFSTYSNEKNNVTFIDNFILFLIEKIWYEKKFILEVEVKEKEKENTFITFFKKNFSLKTNKQQIISGMQNFKINNINFEDYFLVYPFNLIVFFCYILIILINNKNNLPEPILTILNKLKQEAINDISSLIKADYLKTLKISEELRDIYWKIHQYNFILTLYKFYDELINLLSDENIKLCFKSWIKDRIDHFHKELNEQQEIKILLEKRGIRKK